MDQDTFYAGLRARMGYPLSSEQRQVIEADASRLQVLATAGSGKTTTLTVKIGYAIAVLGIPANRMLALSYSKASTMDFRHRFLSLFEGKAAAEVHFSTLHAFALGIVRKAWGKTGQAVRLVDQEGSGYQRYAHLSKVYHQTVGQFATREVLDDLFSEISYVKNALTDLAAYRPRQTGFMACYKAYEAEKERLGLMDFDDMLAFALTALEADQGLLSALQERFTHILVDEAQDINPIQIKLLEKLCQRAQQWIVIGDDDQSIYGFRAADPSFLIDFGKAHGSVVQVQLGQNYRCPPEVVALASGHIQHNKRRLHKRIEAAKGPSAEAAVLKLPYTTLWDQVEQGVAQIAALISQGCPASEIALLVRNHYALVPYLHRLLPLGIPLYLKDDQLGFFNHWVVRDAQLYLAVANGPYDYNLFVQLIGRLKLFLIPPLKEAMGRSVNLRMALQFLVDKVSEKQRPLAKRLMAALTSHRANTPYEQLKQFYEDLDYRVMMVERASRGGYGAAMPLTIWDTYHWLAAEASDYETHRAQLKDFEAAIGALKFSKKGSGVSLMSIHGAKGLEFNHVLLGDLQKSILPAQESAKDAGVLEEERRLFYVGVTRAKERLYLLYPKGSPSPFISQLR